MSLVAIRVKLSSQQLINLAHGKQVRITPAHMGDVATQPLLVNKILANRVSKAFSKGKGVQIKLSEKAIQANWHIGQSGHGIFSSIADKLKSGYEWLKPKIGSLFDSGKEKAKEVAEKVVDKSIDVAQRKLEDAGEKIKERISDKLESYAPPGVPSKPKIPQRGSQRDASSTASGPKYTKEDYSVPLPALPPQRGQPKQPALPQIPQAPALPPWPPAKAKKPSFPKPPIKPPSYNHDELRSNLLKSIRERAGDANSMSLTQEGEGIFDFLGSAAEKIGQTALNVGLKVGEKYLEKKLSGGSVGLKGSGVNLRSYVPGGGFVSQAETPSGRIMVPAVMNRGEYLTGAGSMPLAMGLRNKRVKTTLHRIPAASKGFRGGLVPAAKGIASLQNGMGVWLPGQVVRGGGVFLPGSH